MGSVLFKGGGGGGTYSSDLTTTAGDVLKGKSYVGSDTNDDIGTGTLELTGNAVASQVLTGKTFYNTNAKSKVTGSMTNVAGLENAKTTRVENNNLILGMTNGAHITNSSGKSYPEVQTPYATVASKLGITAAKVANGSTIAGVTGTYKGLGDATQAQVLSGAYFSTASLSNAVGTIPKRGYYQYTTGFGAGTDGSTPYVAFNNIPVGYYTETSGNASWAPEIRMNENTFKDYVINRYGITANKIAFGCEIMGIRGTNSGGVSYQAESPFVNGIFAKNEGINKFQVISWTNQNYGTLGTDTVSLSNDHLHVTTKAYSMDSSLSKNFGYHLRYLTGISFSTVNFITVDFMIEKHTDDGFGYSTYLNSSEISFDIGTTVGGNNLVSQGRSTLQTNGTGAGSTLRTGKLYTMTLDVSSIKVFGYLSIHLAGGSYGQGSSDSYSYAFRPYFNIYAIAFS